MENMKNLKFRRGEANIIGSLFLILIVVVGAILVGYYVFGLIANNQAKTTVEIVNEDFAGGTLYITLKDVGNSVENITCVEVYHDGESLYVSGSNSDTITFAAVPNGFSPQSPSSNSLTLMPGEETVITAPLSGGSPGESVQVFLEITSGQSENSISQTFTLN